MHYNIDTLIDRLIYQSRNNHIPKSELTSVETDSTKAQKNGVIDKDGMLNMEFDVPGFSKNTVTIKSVGNRLFINGETDSRTLNKEYKIQERWDVLNTTAEVLNGVLTISIPPSIRNEVKVKTISVK